MNPIELILKLIPEGAKCPPGISPIHISDGILSWPVLLLGWVVTFVWLAFSLKKIDQEEIPKLSLITACLFVTSLLHLKVGPTSVHFILNGLAGVIAGILAYPAIFVALLLQALLFGYGGITVLGVNAVDMGIPALLSYWVFKLRGKVDWEMNTGIFGTLAGALGVAAGVILTSLMLLTTGSEFREVVGFLIVVHLPIIGIEGAVTGAVATFLSRVKPEILPGGVK